LLANQRKLGAIFVNLRKEKRKRKKEEKGEIGQ
jgi:hypothetical protein